MAENYIIATYDITDTKSHTQILGKNFNLNQVKSLFIDGVEFEISSSHHFESIGFKEVKIIFNSAIFNCCNYLFFDCISLSSLDLSHFNTLNVTSMDGMFHNCSALTSVNLSNLKTDKVTDMYAMFGDCHSLKSIDLSNLNTDNVINMMFMFSNCPNLISITITGNASKAEPLWMFRDISPNGTLYYNNKYDYTHIIQQLPDTWKAIAI